MWFREIFIFLKKVIRSFNLIMIYEIFSLGKIKKTIDI